MACCIAQNDRVAEWLDRMTTRNKFASCLPITLGVFIIVSAIVIADLAMLRILILDDTAAYNQTDHDVSYNGNTHNNELTPSVGNTKDDSHWGYVALIAIELATIIYIMCTRTDPPRPMQPFDCSTPSADSVELLAHVQITAIIGAICACIGLVIPHLEEAAYEKFMLVIVFAVVVISCRLYAAAILYSFAKFIKNGERITVYGVVF